MNTRNDRRDAAINMAHERLTKAGLGSGAWLGVPYLHPDGRADMLAGITLSAADIDARIGRDAGRGQEHAIGVRLSDEQIAWHAIDSGSTPQEHAMALEIHDSRAIIARVKALVDRLRAGDRPRTFRPTVESIADDIEAALRG